MGWSDFCSEYVCLIGIHIGGTFSSLYEPCKGRLFVYEAQPVRLRDDMHFV